MNFTHFCTHQQQRPSRMAWMALLLLITFIACRKGPQVIPSTETPVLPPDTAAHARSFYLLNEGNMGSNKASLDFFNPVTGVYRKNIYNEVNPEVTKGLGDVGNDMKVYGGKLYCAINMSNKVEVLDAHTAKRITQITIDNCRYIAFHGSKVYISSYQGFVGDPNSPEGFIAEIDTTSLTITRTVTVGRQPEEMAIVGNKLYIANSGGYNANNYERTLSVIDLPTFQEIKRIDVAINLHRVKADRYGDLYVTSRGNYIDIPSKLFLIDTQTDQVKKTFDIAASNLCIHNDRAYLYSVEWNHQQQKNTITYGMLNVKEETVLDNRFITDGTEKSIRIPYGIAVDPVTEDVYVTDAKNYVTPGTLYCFDKNGTKKWSVTTGDIPAHFAFVQ